MAQPAVQPVSHAPRTIAGRKAPVTDPVASAKAAGLRYVADTNAGIRRKRTAGGVQYIGPDGHIVRDPETLRRIKSLAIPPAWQDVWICPLQNGHLQATGRDAKGRKQYRYHPRWREVRDETKYDRMIAFGNALPHTRRQVQQDLSRPGLSREKVLATVVRLLETTLIRVGNDQYAKQNESFGLTTMRDHHVDVSGATVTFTFKGKAASGTPSISSIGGLRTSSNEAEIFPAMNCFSISMTTAFSETSSLPTSTPIFARSPDRTSPPKIFGPGLGRYWPQQRFRNLNRLIHRLRPSGMSSRPLSRSPSD